MTSTVDTTSLLRQRPTKVPVVVATFWAIKILSTTIGETFADYLSVNVGLGPVLTDGVVFAALAAMLTLQFRARRYTPWIYWLCVVLVSIFGTQVTDFLTDTLGVSLYLSTAGFAAILAVVFWVWHRQEMTLSIASINTPRREAFYWGAILTTFALGTAAGDLATEALNLGFRNGSLIFGALFLVTLSLGRITVWQVLAFWVAYILTRPLGASLGDLLTQDQGYGGLGLGASLTSALFFVVIVVLVAREQILVTGGAAPQPPDAGQGAVPPGRSRTADRIWAASGATVIVASAGWFSAVAPGTGQSSTQASTAIATPTPAAAASAAPGSPASPGPSAAASPAAATRRPTPSKLGDLTSFSTIVADVSAMAARGDLAAAKTRVKDLEIAWDTAEAGLKPRSPSEWHSVDGGIDAVLTTLRADHPAQTDCVAALTALQKIITTLP